MKPYMLLVSSPSTSNILDHTNISFSGISILPRGGDGKPERPACEEEERALYLVRLICTQIMIPIISVVGVTSNLLNIIVLTRPCMQSSTNMYLRAVAVCDLLYGLSVLPLALRSSLEARAAYMLLLPYLMALGNLWSNTAGWLTCTFTVERYIAVSAPMLARKLCTRQRSRWVIAIVCACCFLLTLPDFFQMTLKTKLTETSIDNQTKGIYSSKTNNIMAEYLAVIKFGVNATLPAAYNYSTVRQKGVCSESMYKLGNSKYGNWLDASGWPYCISALFVFLPLITLGVFNILLIRSVIRANRRRRGMGIQKFQFRSQDSTLKIKSMERIDSIATAEKYGNSPDTQLASSTDNPVDEMTISILKPRLGTIFSQRKKPNSKLHKSTISSRELAYQSGYFQWRRRNQPHNNAKIVKANEVKKGIQRESSMRLNYAYPPATDSSCIGDPWWCCICFSLRNWRVSSDWRDRGENVEVSDPEMAKSQSRLGINGLGNARLLMLNNHLSQSPYITGTLLSDVKNIGEMNHKCFFTSKRVKTKDIEDEKTDAVCSEQGVAGYTGSGEGSALVTGACSIGGSAGTGLFGSTGTSFGPGGGQERQRITVMLIAVVVAFCLLNVPSALISLMRHVRNAPVSVTSKANSSKTVDHHWEKQLQIAGNFSNLFLVVNSALNFFFYSWLSLRFRRTFRHLLGCKCANKPERILSLKSSLTHLSNIRTSYHIKVLNNIVEL
ncbi:unnamed protein product [Protopolystoma xenopodis]|uniref:G-protein coupled receptors family 1 profile domain-containing protein n=1 Tax=Protopolystoma xenopodis TaxID=117903 RepID=A0A448XGF3_9PLAT|nr:unnamed protein product [Protopolystoma xenopodis]